MMGSSRVHLLLLLLLRAPSPFVLVVASFCLAHNPRVLCPGATSSSMRRRRSDDNAPIDDEEDDDIIVVASQKKTKKENASSSSFVLNNCCYICNCCCCSKQKKKTGETSSSFPPFSSSSFSPSLKRISSCSSRRHRQHLAETSKINREAERVTPHTFPRSSQTKTVGARACRVVLCLCARCCCCVFLVCAKVTVVFFDGTKHEKRPSRGCFSSSRLCSRARERV